MISGHVNSRIEAIIPVALNDSSGNSVTVAAIIDTGFTGDLTLTSNSILNLGLQQTGEFDAVLADGSMARLPFFTTLIEWDGVIRSIEVLHIDADPLVGMHLLLGKRLTVDIMVNGSVTVGEIP